MRERARTFFHLVSTSRVSNPRVSNPWAIVAAANIRGRDPEAVLLCPAREIREIRSEIKKPTYSACARPYLCAPHGRTPVILCPTREVRAIRSEIKKPTYSALSRTYICPPCGRTPMLLHPARAEVWGEGDWVKFKECVREDATCSTSCPHLWAARCESCK